VQWQFLFTSSLVAIVPVVILFIIIEKWLVGGLTAGAVK
jgi:multiple sugar transport system permease protein